MCKLKYRKNQKLCYNMIEVCKITFITNEWIFIDKVRKPYIVNDIAYII